MNKVIITILFWTIGILLCVQGGFMGSKSSLKEYQKKRNFSTTPEPLAILKKKSPQEKFVIQLHHASHKHYDFRIEIDGVLKSWAIPKGISTNPKIKRLAIPTEDHPISYAQFEGVIPKENYGAGTVMIWDYGTYRNIKHVERQNCLHEKMLAKWSHRNLLKREKIKGQLCPH